MSMSSKAFVPYQNGVLYKENKGGKPSAVRCAGGKAFYCLSTSKSILQAQGPWFFSIRDSQRLKTIARKVL